MWNAPHCSATRPSSTSAASAVDERARSRRRTRSPGRGRPRCRARRAGRGRPCRCRAPRPSRASTRPRPRCRGRRRRRCRRVRRRAGWRGLSTCPPAYPRACPRPDSRLHGPRRAPAIRLSVTPDESAPEREASLADEPEVRQALAEADRASVASVVAGHPSSPLAWAELADLADSEGHTIDALAYAAIAVDLAREQLARRRVGARRLRAVVRRAQSRLPPRPRRPAPRGPGARPRRPAARLADELAAADAEAPARIASEFTPTQLIPIVASAATLRRRPPDLEAHTGEPLAEPAAADAAGED